MVNIPQLCIHVPPSSLPVELGGTFQVDHKTWLQYCLKSTTNRNLDGISEFQDDCPSQVQNGTVMPYNGIISENGLININSSFNDSEMDIDDTSEHHNSVHEKQNSEDREKEVEVIKEDLLQLSVVSIRISYNKCIYLYGKICQNRTCLCLNHTLNGKNSIVVMKGIQ